MANVNVENGDAQTIYNSIQILVDKDEERRNHENQVSPSIYKVHSTLRDLSPTSFNPRVVAIGPLHKQDKKLEAIEGHKVTYMFHLFQHLKTTPPNQQMNECVQRVHGEIGRIRACYAGEMKSYNDVEVAQMMVIDGCFLLEFILRRLDREEPVGDPIFDNTLLIQGVTLDLVLIENQIPFFVLQHIFNCTILKILPLSLTKLILSFLEFINPFAAPFNTNNDGAYINYDHILDLLQKSCRPADAQPSSFLKSRFHSAVELRRAGVNFKCNQQDEPQWVLAMEFKSSRFPCFFWSWGKSTLKMPALIIEDHTELIMRNLIAYEQCSRLIHTYITSYAFALDMLVDTEQDVLQLVESEVLTNHLGSNQDAANMINNIGKEIAVERFYDNEQFQKLYDFYDKCWPKNIAWVRRTYFNSPWNFIALLAAIILFALTVVQTFVAIKAA